MDMDTHTHTHVVQKPLYDGEHRRLRNECVDASSWRNEQKLVDNRWLTLLAPNITPVEDSEGRFWLPGKLPPDRELKEGAPAQASEWPQKQKGSWWELSDGTRLQGEAKARKAQEALMQPA